MKRRTEVSVADLLGTPWARMRCAELALYVLREKLGIPVPEHALGVALGDPDNAKRAVEYLDSGEGWQFVGRGSWEAKVLGDLVVWTGNPVPHVGVLVNESHRMLMTTQHPEGAHVIKTHRIPAAGCKVYRWGGS